MAGSFTEPAVGDGVALPGMGTSCAGMPDVRKAGGTARGRGDGVR